MHNTLVTSELAGFLKGGVHYLYTERPDSLMISAQQDNKIAVI